MVNLQKQWLQIISMHNNTHVSSFSGEYGIFRWSYVFVEKKFQQGYEQIVDISTLPTDIDKKKQVFKWNGFAISYEVFRLYIWIK
jgi:hypothetical protein